MKNAVEGSQFIMFMSDNLWIADKMNGEIRWLSLDGAKMEASHSNKDVESYLDFMREQYNWDPHSWEFYALSVRNMMVGAEVLLGSYTYTAQHLASGFPNTADVNCIKMARIVKYLILLWNQANHDTQHEETPRVVKHYEQLHGKSLPKNRTLYELWLTGDLKPAFDSEGVTMTETLHNPTVLSTLD